MEEAAAPDSDSQNIDPSLRSQVPLVIRPSNIASPPECLPDGRLVPRETYHQYLLSIKRKSCLTGACASLSISHPKRATLERLRGALLDHWYSYSPTRSGVAPSLDLPPHTPPRRTPASPTRAATATATPSAFTSPTGDETDDVDDETLRDQFYVDCNAAADVFAYDRGAEDGDEEDDEPIEDATLFSFDMDDPDDFTSYQRSMRIDAAKRFEDNRRAGVLLLLTSPQLFLAEARGDGRVPDEIVDEHSLLVFINYTAERPKRNRKGEYISGTRVGASQIKKEFFGALRIRKVQDAADPTLATRRPAATVHVYDLVKARMNEALISARLGLVPNEDAPDIVANTFLASVTDQQLRDIGYGFLQHRELRPTSASTSAPKPLAERLSAPHPLPDFKRKSAEDAKGILLKKVHATADRFQAIFDKKHLFDRLDGESQKALHCLADQLNWVDDNIDKVSTWSKEQRKRISWACKQVGRVEFSTDTESLARRKSTTITIVLRKLSGTLATKTTVLIVTTFLITHRQEDFIFANSFSEASSPPGPEHVARLPSPSSTVYSPLTPLSEVLFEAPLEPIVFESEEFNEFILLTTTMGDVKPDAIPVLAQASQYANWSAAMRGYLTFIEAWPAIAPGTTTDANYGKMNSRAQGVLLMRTERNIHHHLLKEDGETLKTAKEMWDALKTAFGTPDAAYSWSLFCSLIKSPEMSDSKPLHDQTNKIVTRLKEVVAGGIKLDE
ncbi:hypothetical protein EVJ58_g8149 [Rhodofomes roseus]|uniref:Uncharacterized protein n=1 Tax=Rhodofomes roseus TaxID=34475 RepID=A0A4Y9Y1J9_9APHY|nr:hypothetical protein EVJ58_g8149 [Rhodofomes roseus]